MFWELRSTFEGVRDEYRGWHKFRQATGVWPVYSVLAGVLSIPALFGVGTYVFVRALQTHRLPLIYTVLTAVAVCGVGSWYGLRRLACVADIAKAKRSGPISAETLKKFIR
jgi:hypothetical protein